MNLEIIATVAPAATATIDADVDPAVAASLDASVVTVGSGGTSDHTQLTNRDAAEQHPISSITGLQAALDAKAAATDIPTALSQLSEDNTHRTVTDAEKALWGAKYDKPSGGIGTSDLSASVNTSLGNANTAIQPADYNPVAKTSAMTQAVGKDSDGRLWTSPGSGGSSVTSVNGQTGDVTLDAEDVGALPDTTSIPSKTSDLVNDSGFLTEHQSLAAYRTSADQDVIDAGKADLVDGRVPSAQLPSYVDDVLEYPGIGSFPAVGEAGKIYVDTLTNKTYRWGGSEYVEISASLALGETSSTAYRGDRGKAAYDHLSDTSNPHSVTAAQVGAKATSNVEDIEHGGTGATTAADARTALGITPANIGALPAFTLKWTNASPASPFASQTISLDLSGYSWVLILFRHSNGGASAVMSSIVNVGNTARLMTGSPDNNRIGMRSARVETTEVVFSGCTFNGSTNNDVCIPMHIYAC